ncbi:fumarylacetoacetate hydrolase family protein [Thermorudis peleae]|uniref:fumarylacetoacetate hydrolase family protein n=1 Tax=Thermorudis peleae TaxID=1382356 RepID=UPI00057078C7|nr:fumarylacetoacetate hydrolase family protein [Thermorudis peleae]MBX6754172.1 fumarylacetoacetate hydrolase family protein [Thermorudis peleae]
MQLGRVLLGDTPVLVVVENGVAYRADGDPFQGVVRKGEEIGPFAAQTVLPPVARPSKIVAVGLNYALHVTENDPTRTIPDEPVLFMKPPSALLGHGGTILLPPGNRIDYEAELCLVIGRRASRVPESSALDYVLGYTCGNDVSHRDYQRKDGQWVRAKGFDTFCPLGPVIVTDLDPNDLAICSRLNGEVRQNNRTSNMLFPPAFLVSFISNVMTLEPGDVIMTGTPEGVGPMKPGDVIEVEIEGIGVLRNTVAARPAEAAS